MEIIWIVGGFVLGVIFFLLINELFEIWYLGFAGISGTFMSCWAVGIAIMAYLGVLVKWIVIIGVILWVISKFSKGNNAKQV